jgi:large conductance mechanosensitive channel
MEKNFLDKKIEETVKQTIKEYRDFAFKDDIKKVCAAVILGSSFDSLIRNISTNLIMPFFNFIINKTNGDWRDYIIILLPGLELGVGKFLGGVLDFTIISIVLFILLKRIWK